MFLKIECCGLPPTPHPLLLQHSVLSLNMTFQVTHLYNRTGKMVKLLSQSSNNTQFVRTKGYLKLIKDRAPSVKILAHLTCFGSL